MAALFIAHLDETEESSLEDPIRVKPGESAIILGRNSEVLYSDFDPLIPGKQPLFLPDIVSKKDVDLLRLIRVAMDRPGHMVEANISFRSTPMYARALHQEDYRTHIIFSAPKAGVGRKPRI